MILVAGEALVDLVVQDERILPSPGGGPYNTARALARLGARAGFLGHVSEDYFGRMLADDLESSGVSLEFTTRGSEPSALAVAQTVANGDVEYSFYLSETALGAPTGSPLRTPTNDVRALHVGSLALALEPSGTAIEALVERERGKLAIVVDPNVRPATIVDVAAFLARFDRCCRAASVVKLSASDAQCLFGDMSLPDVAARLIDLGPKLVVITLGAAGALALTADGGSFRASSPQVDTLDTIGAGDAFGAGLMFALEARDLLEPDGPRAIEQQDLGDVLRFATTVAALTCTRAGANTPTFAEVEEFLGSAA